MTVILAVEPDPRQASRLSSVLRGRRNTEVVIARSADTAIESIAGRVPNVLLTSPLLSPQDETRLADWLRELGPSGSHVRALTIPILAPKVAKEPPQRGLLASLRRRTRNLDPHGCEPKMFAEHVAAYLSQEPVDAVDEKRFQLEALVADFVSVEACVLAHRADGFDVDVIGAKSHGTQEKSEGQSEKYTSGGGHDEVSLGCYLTR